MSENKSKKKPRARASDAVLESKKLLKRGRKSVKADVRAEVESCREELAASLAKKNADNEIEKGTEKLENLLDKYLSRFRKPAWRESAESIFIAILVALILRSFVLEAFKIPSGSMIPTLAVGDQIFVNKYVFGVRVPFTAKRIVDFSIPDRGDVVVFICPAEPNEDYIKRVIGLPGDKIELRAGRLYLNDEALPREFMGKKTFPDRNQNNGQWDSFEAEVYHETIDGKVHTILQDPSVAFGGGDFGPYKVPEGHLFMMGDNRDHSSDSRYWGPVPLSNVLGRSLFVWWSWGADGFASDRFGTWIN